MDDLLLQASRCVVAQSGPLRRAPFWFDGNALWLADVADSPLVHTLRGSGRSAVYVAPERLDQPGIVVRGAARVYGTHDPVALAVHAPVVAAAVSALAVRNAAGLAELLADMTRAPARLLPRNRVAMRLAVESRAEVPTPQAPPGIAPALPPAVPAGVRRAVAGCRDVVLVTADSPGPGQALDIGPAVWGPSYRLDLPPGRLVADGTAATVAVLGPVAGARGAATGITLTGVMVGSTLQPQRASWWRGNTVQVAELAPVAAGVTLPD